MEKKQSYKNSKEYKRYIKEFEEIFLKSMDNFEALMDLSWSYGYGDFYPKAKKQLIRIYNKHKDKKQFNTKKFQGCRNEK